VADPSRSRLVVVGDSIPFAGFCPGCTVFTEQYAKTLEQRLGRPVDVANRSRDDTAGLPEIVAQLADDATLHDQIEAADVVVVSIGGNNALPDPTSGVGCGGDLGSGVEGYIEWARTTTDPCLAAGVATYARQYDDVFASIAGIHGPRKKTLIALNTYDANLDNADFRAAQVSDSTRVWLARWIVRNYERWNRMQCDRARLHGFVCVDIYHAFNGPRGAVPLTDLLEDGSHPSQKGNDLIASLLARVKTT
jgi:lysophospholipase L1-like esterase